MHPNSIVFDTGGLKYAAGTMTMDHFYKQLYRTLPVLPENRMNMYGMTELSTQYYSVVDNESPIKVPPFWLRFKIIDPLSGEEVQEGEAGVLVHVDVANVTSVPAIVTKDVAVQRGEGFELIGRQEQAEPTGCSLSMKQYLEGKTQ
ncbi:hypothetical protein [Geomicrobium sp. JCM 19039]|uniref:LuxE/PaaK family acyltransferase n=1 Tax=Geomicrobium sp. JCM 19039 TaxID=1460636 RepID=UPI0035A60374